MAQLDPSKASQVVQVQSITYDQEQMEIVCNDEQTDEEHGTYLVSHEGQRTSEEGCRR